MKKGSRSFIVLALVVSFVTGPAFFGFAAKANADTGSCLAGVLAGLFKGKTDQAQAEGEGVRGQIMTVPTYDAAVKAYEKANQKTNSNTSGQAQGFTVQRCIVEPIVVGLVRSLLNTFTAQTIAWINGGFKGSPLFVTNPQGFLTDIADQTIGQFIEGLGPIGQILCSPFDFQLRLSLNLQFGGGGYRQEIGCRLTDIQQNVQKAFTGGSFGQNGWDNWLNLTAYPQNNPYGAYIKGVNALDVAIIGRQTISLKELDWGKGFLSSVDPETGEVSTPGSIIEGQLTKTLGVEVERVGLAKDLDAIIGALAGQLINQVMGAAGGLLGASKPTGGSSTRPGQSPVQRVLAMNPGATVAENTRAQNLPDGVLPYDEVTKSFWTVERFCTAFQNNLYFVNKDDKTIRTQVGTKGADGKITYGTKVTSYKGAVVNGKPGSIPWTLDDYNSITKYCMNYTQTSSVKSATDAFTAEVDKENEKFGSASTETVATAPPVLPKNPDGTPSSPVSFTPAEQEARPDTTNYYNHTYKDFQSTFRMTANQGQTGLKARIKLLATPAAGGADQNQQFSTIFAKDSFAFNELPLDVSKNIIIFNENFNLSSGEKAEYKITGTISDFAQFTASGSYTSYKIVTEFFKVVADKEQVIATQTTTLKIQ